MQWARQVKFSTAQFAAAASLESSVSALTREVILVSIAHLILGVSETAYRGAS